MSSNSTLENLDREELLQSSRRLLAEAQALSSRLAAVNEIATAINRKLDMNEILRVVGKQAKWLLDFDHCSVCLRQGTEWRVKILFGPDSQLVEPYVPLGGSVLDRALATGQAQIVMRGSTVDFLLPYSSQILIPLRSEQHTLGTIQFAKSAVNAYTAEDLRIGYLLALQLAGAMRNALVLEELQQAHKELERRNQELDAYTHTIAHDLKSPLQSVLTYTELLAIKNRGLFDDKSKEYVGYVKNSVHKMGDMIDQLLWLAKLRDETEAIQITAIRPIVDAALLRLKPNFTAKLIQIVVEPDFPDALGHDQWIEEIFANLISNAIKYIGKDNPQPRIVVRGYLKDQWARYEVEDNGIGIDPAAQAQLFEMFTRLHTEEAEGLGLGLSIVRRIISKLNGTVGVDSSPGKGSIFWFMLPTANTAPSNQQ